NLSHVGGILGPDLVGLEQLLEKAAGRQVIAAGGVRGQTDLQSLANLGVSAVLVGSALHDGRLDLA
ncbi:MAG: HisA/HisF-related TIM barrel protein, partial [Gammaproteobacteria bacterium]